MTRGYIQQPAYYLWHNAKARAKRKHVPFDIEFADVKIPTHCPALGIPLFVTEQGTGDRDNSPSLDRLTPEKGYVKGNIAVISFRANQIKNYSNPTEMRRIADWLEGELNKCR